MRVWRLVRPRFAPGLDGEGARLAGGRWNSPGRPMVYCAGSVALATLEVLVNLPPELRQGAGLPTFVLIGLDIPDDDIDGSGPGQVPDEGEARAFGDKWLASRRSLALAVPSAVVPHDRNVLVNPAHARAALIAPAVKEPFLFDARLADPKPLGL